MVPSQVPLSCRWNEHHANGQPTSVTLRALRTSAIIGVDAWSRSSKAQPLVLDLALSLDTSTAGSLDDITQSWSYGLMCKDVLAAVEGQDFGSIDDLIARVSTVAQNWPGEKLDMEVRAPKALLRCDEGLAREVGFERVQNEWRRVRQGWSVKGLRVACVIGVNAHERLQKQDVIVGLSTGGRQSVDEGHPVMETDGHELWQKMVRAVCEAVETSSFQTLEALGALIAKTCLEQFLLLPHVTVLAEKPSALAAVEGAGVKITRDRDWLDRIRGDRR